jgi:hypothetical protein
VARGDPVDGIGVVRYPDAVSGQLVTKSYRPRTGDHWGFVQLDQPRAQLLGPVDTRLPDPLARRRVERGEDLAPPAVENRERHSTVPFRCLGWIRNRRIACLADSGRQRVQGADAAGRQAEADSEPARGRDPDPQAGEGAGAEADGDQVDRLPAARRRGRPLDLLEQAGRVQGPPLRGEAELRLVKYLAVAPGAGDGVYRRGIEPDDDQGFATR